MCGAELGEAGGREGGFGSDVYCGAVEAVREWELHCEEEDEKELGFARATVGVSGVPIEGVKVVPFASYLGDVPCWEAATQETIKAWIESADRIPLWELVLCIFERGLRLRAIICEAEITLERPEHVGAESLDIVDRYFYALGEGGGVKS